ncbi:MBL fold metallo-hydrolase [Thermincola potens]|uniref:Metallo-beta-lactamase domain-containing protein n=1 Tax=Thermincola potens (strain JR) TaxID=635013 RepID=D5XC97_THEPJ|nr:MBL fold metallo-hydrolase [Thermincola potens]ADG83549.1 conserved hypothetical protein [Thermincola potens JR]
MISLLDRELRNLTLDAMMQARTRWKHRSEQPAADWGKFIWFMGTGGNPEATIGQCPATAGFVLGLGKSLIYVDPGPGAPSKAAKAGVDPGYLDAIYISHGHTDHYAGVESLIEGMCWAMSRERGLLLVPQKVLAEGLISRFHQGLGDKDYYKGGPQVQILRAYEKVNINELILTPIPVHHGGENYGFVLDAGGLRIGYTSDTNYITSFVTPEGIKEYGRWGPVMDLLEVEDYREDLKKVFAEVDVLIANVTSHNALMHRHLTAIGLAHLLKNSSVRMCIITHFGYSCVHPVDLRDKIAQYVTTESGVLTIAARDLQKFELDNF